MTKKICFQNLCLFDGIHNNLQNDRIILVRDNQIVAVEDQATRDRYHDYSTYDLHGQTMIPGLIDAHIHLTVPLATSLNARLILQMGRQVAMNFQSCLKYGVTTIRDLGAFSKKMQRWIKKIGTGNVPGPRTVTALSFLSSRGGIPEMAPTLNPIESIVAGGQFVERLETPEEVRKAANRNIDNGAQWLKTQYSEESFLFHGRLQNWGNDCFQTLMDVSKTRGVPVAMHHTEATAFKKGVELGVTSLEHCSFQELAREDVDRMVQKGVSIVPTIKAPADFLNIESVLEWLNGAGKTDFMPEPYRQTITSAELMLSKPYPPKDYQKNFYTDIEMFRRGYPNMLKNVEKIKKSGGKVGVGTDSCGTGLGFVGQYWKELWHLTQAGFSNFEALRAATAVNAEIIGLGDKVGTIEPGKFADFIVLKGNPLDDLRAVQNVRMVFIGGEKKWDAPA